MSRKTRKSASRPRPSNLPSRGTHNTITDRQRLYNLADGISRAIAQPNPEPFPVVGQQDGYEMIADARWYLRLVPNIPPEDAVILGYLFDLPDERRRAISSLLSQAHLFIGRNGGRIARDPFLPIRVQPAHSTNAQGKKRKSQRQLPAPVL